MKINRKLLLVLSVAMFFSIMPLRSLATTTALSCGPLTLEEGAAFDGATIF